MVGPDGPLMIPVTFKPERFPSLDVIFHYDVFVYTRKSFQILPERCLNCISFIATIEEAEFFPRAMENLGVYLPVL